LDLDWESGLVLVQIANAKRPAASIEVYAELKDEMPICPIDENKVEIHACRGTKGDSACPFYIKASEKDYCTFKKFGAAQVKTSLDEFIEQNKKREVSLRIATAVLNVLPVPKKVSAAIVMPKDDEYKPVTRRATVVKGSHKGVVAKKNKDGSFMVKWDDGKQGAYWAHELTVIE